MGTKIDDFKSQMRSFARPNLFEAEIFPPSSGFAVKYYDRKFNIGCHTASIPGRSVLTYDKNESGRAIAYDKASEDVTLGFYVNEDMKIIQFFQDWMRVMSGIYPSGGHVGYYDNYISTVNIKTLARGGKVADSISSAGLTTKGNNRVTMTTILHDAYPKGLSATPLSYETDNEVMKIDITFTYRYYTQTFGELQEVVGRGGESFTEMSAEDIPNPLSDINTLKEKTGNLVTKNAQGFFVPKRHRINQ